MAVSSGIDIQQDNLRIRSRNGLIWYCVVFMATISAVLALAVLILSIVNNAFGYVVVKNTIMPHTLVEEMGAGSSRELQQLKPDEFISILQNHLRRGRYRALNAEKPLNERSQSNLYNLVVDNVVEPRVLKSWTLKESLFGKKSIQIWTEKEFPGAEVQFRSWVSFRFLNATLSTVPEKAGLRMPILGSFMVIMVTILFSFPIGVGTALHLEEFAQDTRLNRIIEINIYNLSGVPSIIYGLLGLAVFVRFMEPITSGAIFGMSHGGETANGRTILSAGLTLGLLILPIIIINTQEALKAIPQSLRDSAYGLGATRWQVIWHHVLPAAMDRILTGAIIAVSRALGETAPLVVIGASAFLTRDPSSIFDKFTTMPIMIYNWTAYPQEEFRNLAAAAIIVLLVLLLSLNAGAIILRDKIGKKRRA